MGVGLVTDAGLCGQIYKDFKNNQIVFWKIDEEAGKKETSPVSEIHVIQGSDTKEILNSVLGFLPNPKLLDDSDFRVRNSYFITF